MPTHLPNSTRPTLRSLAAWSALLVLASGGAVRGAESRIPITGPVTITTPGSYILTRDIVTAGGHAVVVSTVACAIDLNGHTITATNGGDTPVLLTNAADVVITRGRIVGGTFGIEVVSGASLPRATIDHVTFSGQVSHGVYTLDAADVVIEDCIFRNQNVAIAVEGANWPTQFRVARNNIQGLVGFETIGDLARGIIEGNVLYLTAGVGINLTGRGLDVRGNVIDSGANGISITGGGGHRIEGNTITRSTGSGLAVFGDNNRIFGNTITASQYDGLYVASQGNVIESNLVNANLGVGIGFAGASGTQNVYRTNTVRGNAGGAFAGQAGNTDGGGNF